MRSVLRQVGCAAMLAAWMVLPGCRAGLLDDGEFTRSQCGDGVDNDMDGLTDCEEPSCKVFELCTLQFDPDAAPPQDAGEDARVADAAPPFDAGKKDAVVPDATVKMDAAPPMEPDAGPCQADGGRCSEGELCIESACVEPFPGGYSVVVQSAVVPQARMVMDGLECFDASTGGQLTCDVFEECDCVPPDPFVRVRLDDTVFDQTSTMFKTTMPNWAQSEEAAIPVQIDDSGATLTLEVHDDDRITDPTNESVIMFECSFQVDIDRLPLQELSCTREFEGGTAELHAQLIFLGMP